MSARAFIHGMQLAEQKAPTSFLCKFLFAAEGAQLALNRQGYQAFQMVRGNSTRYILQVLRARRIRSWARTVSLCWR